MINELNELQTYKLIRTDLTLIVYAIVMEGFGVKYWATYDAQLISNNSDSPSNYTLFFFVTTCLIYLIASI